MANCAKVATYRPPNNRSPKSDGQLPDIARYQRSDMNMQFEKLARPRQPYERAGGAYKPHVMEHVRVGGWAEVCIGKWRGEEDQIVFGEVVAIEDGTIYLRVNDQVCSFTKTGLADNDLIAVELEDLFGSEYSPRAIQVEREWLKWEAATKKDRPQRWMIAPDRLKVDEDA
jgi:hypothetical protein